MLTHRVKYHDNPLYTHTREKNAQHTGKNHHSPSYTHTHRHTPTHTHTHTPKKTHKHGQKPPYPIVNTHSLQKKRAILDDWGTVCTV